MANPNILNITSVTLSSNSVTLPAEPSPTMSNYFNWSSANTNSVRLLLTNPVGSNQVIKITSMIAEHQYSNNYQGAPGVTIFTTNAGDVASSSNARNYLYGGVEQISYYEYFSSTSYNNTATYGSPNFGSPFKTPSTANSTLNSNLPVIMASTINKSLICTPDFPFYLTEGFSLHGVSRVLQIVNNLGTANYYSYPVIVRYSYERIQ